VPARRAARRPISTPRRSRSRSSASSISIACWLGQDRPRGLPQIVPVTEFRDVFGVALTNAHRRGGCRGRAEEGDRDLCARAGQERAGLRISRSRHGRACPDHPRFADQSAVQDVDARHKGEHDGWFQTTHDSTTLPASRPSPTPGATAAFQHSADFTPRYWLFSVPAVLVIAAVIVFPWLFTLYMSTQDWKIGGGVEFVGLQNFAELFRDAALHRIDGAYLLFHRAGGGAADPLRHGGGAGLPSRISVPGPAAHRSSSCR
jgi:hypothetical protein